MAKINVWSLPAPRVREATQTFEHPDYPGVVVTFTLRDLDAIGRAGIRERADELTREYVTGLVDEEGDLVLDAEKEPVQRPLPFAGPDGTGVRLNATVVSSFAWLELSQSGPPAERYSFPELVGLCLRLPRLYEQVSAWALAFVNGEPDPKNASSASAESSSALPSS